MTQPFLYHAYDKASRRNTTVQIDQETGLPLIIKVQDTRPVIESAKRIASNFDPHKRNPEGWTHVARIPRVIWQRLVQTGVAKDPQALNAWLNNRDNSVFRTDDRRKL